MTPQKVNSLPLLLLCAFLMIASCSREQVPDGDWSIPQDEIRDGGPGKDGIPSVDSPQFSEASAASYLLDEDLVVGYAVGDDVRAYPHPILDWHEIVNDEVGGEPIAITYCPLTGTAIGWDREVNGVTTTFGVSGLLYESNLIPYDRSTESNWSQMDLECVNGALRGTRVVTHPVLETTWATWKEMYPGTQVMTTNTGHDRNYSNYPYGDYRTNDAYIIFPVSNTDERLPAKERVHGTIVNGQAVVHRFSAFANTGEGDVVVRIENLLGRQIVLAGNVRQNWIVAYETGGRTDFFAVQEGGSIIMEDGASNRYDVLGRVISGPREGERLTSTDSYIGYWFAWGTFFPGAEIKE